jgi:TolA-binding protein
MPIAVRWLVVLLSLLSGGTRLFAASAEDRAYSSALAAFQDAGWDRAEREFTEFTQKFPSSPRLPEIIRLQAEARFRLGNFSGTVDLLLAHRAQAGQFADQYAFWLAEGYYGLGNYAAAAEAYSKAVQDFPTSHFLLSAAVGEAAARAKLAQWPRVIELLQQTNSVFQGSIRNGVTNEYISRGFLLLTQAQLERRDLASASNTLQLLATRSLSPKLDWQRRYLQSRWQVAENQLEPALQETSGLITAASGANDAQFLAESVALRASILEALGRNAEAIANYKTNLTETTPGDHQRQALFKVAQLALSQTNLNEAAQMLNQFLGRFSNSPAADVAMFALGELNLQAVLATTGAGRTNYMLAGTNHLEQALMRFDTVLNTFTNSPLVGKALLNKGWCLWLTNKLAESVAAFHGAVAKLPLSKDQAIARYKLADALYALKDFAGALSNYTAIAENYASLPDVRTNLVEPALYQSVRVCDEAANAALTNAAARTLNWDIAATNAITKILAWFPDSFLTDASVLIAGQGISRRGNPVLARQVYQNQVQRIPQSTNRAEIELAIARTYEQEDPANWGAAIGQYDGWVERFADHPARARVEYLRGRANSQSGRATNALIIFSNLVARFPNDPLTPLGQWWIADYFWNVGTNYVEAERNYKLFFQTWPTNDLACEARMQAGRAAVARTGYKDAIDHFTNITSRLDCPPELRAQAMFAYGDVLMSMGSTEAARNNLEEAIRVFGQIDPNSEIAILATGRIGDCYKQLGAFAQASGAQERALSLFEQATNAYHKVGNSPRANASARSEAQCALADLAEKQAQQFSGEQQTSLLNQALNYYLDILYEKNLRDGEERDLIWTARAGEEAARLAQTLQQWDRAARIYERLQDLIPPSRDKYEKKKLKAQEQARAKS